MTRSRLLGGAAAVELQKLGHRVLGVEIDGALAESYLVRLTRVVQADASDARIIDTVKAPGSPYYAPWTRVLLLTCPPVDTIQRGADLASRDPPRGLDRDFEVTRQYAEAARLVGEKAGVPVIDVWTLLWEGCGKEEKNLAKFLYDGLHVNELAYGVWSSVASRVSGH